jgi:glutathione S-transferase
MTATRRRRVVDINEYLEDRYPAPPLLPPRPASRRVRLLVDFANRFFFHTSTTC